MGDLGQKRLFLLDMDGTIYLDDRLFPGVLPFLEALGEAEVIDRLRRTQPDTLTPIEAMGLLYEWKQKLG